MTKNLFFKIWSQENSHAAPIPLMQPLFLPNATSITLHSAPIPPSPHAAPILLHAVPIPPQFRSYFPQCSPYFPQCMQPLFS